jgi:hypothetical protein
MSGADTSSGAPRSNVGDDRLRLDIAPARVELNVGEQAEITVEVTNTSDTIRMFQVDVLGVDRSDVIITAPVLQLFPEERGSSVLYVSLPASYPAGPHRLGVRISEPGVTSVPDVVGEFDVVAPAMPALEVTADPSTSTGGSSTTFIATLVNTGNTTIDAGVSVTDAERVVTAEVSPEVVSLPPGARGTVQLDVSGPRPWFGMPVIRTVEITAHTPPEMPRLPDEPEASSFTAVAFAQRPRLSRRAVSIAGLLIAVTVFALVINASFASVADLSKANEALLKQSLGADEVAGERADPGAIGGSVSATTGGGIDGATVEIYEDSTSAVVPVASTVTDADGVYSFGSLPAGVYRVRFTAAGFGELWYPDGGSIADAFPIDLGTGSTTDAVDIALTGQVGAVAGRVIGEDPTGAIVAVEIPSDTIEGSDEAGVATVVAAVEIDATGTFELGQLPTPSVYQLVVAKDGYATETLRLDLSAGESVRGLEVLLRRGDGRITGTVVDATGTPVPGVDLSASDGITTFTTRTLSGASAGTFEFRDLTTPVTLTLAAEPEGYSPQSVTLTLADGQQINDLRIVLAASTGSLAGTVTGADGSQLGGVTVRAVGGEADASTRTLSIGDVGAWRLDGLPVPGDYTVTFSGEGLQPQAVAVSLPAGAGADRSGVDVILSPSLASMSGLVVEIGGSEIGGVAVDLASSSVTRSTITADVPAGQFRFDNLPPGSYTLSFSRVGSSPQTLLVDVTAGQAATIGPVEIEAQARITGVVTRAEVPTADVGVQAYRLADYPSTAAATTLTAPDGSFTIIGIDAPETYVIEFRVPAGGPVAESRTVFLPAGQTLDMDVVEL